MAIRTTLSFENLPNNKDFTSTFVNKLTPNEHMFLHFHFVTSNFSDKSVQMQTMKIVRHSRPTHHKSDLKILIYGPILKI